MMPSKDEIIAPQKNISGSKRLSKNNNKKKRRKRKEETFEFSISSEEEL